MRWVLSGVVLIGYTPQKGSGEKSFSMSPISAAPLPFALPVIIWSRPVELGLCTMWHPPPPCGGPVSAAAAGTLAGAVSAAATAGPSDISIDRASRPPSLPGHAPGPHEHPRTAAFEGSCEPVGMESIVD